MGGRPRWRGGLPGPQGARLGGREARLGRETAVQVGELRGPDKEAAVTGCVEVHLCVRVRVHACVHACVSMKACESKWNVETVIAQ